jgi:hypothetical protein
MRAAAARSLTACVSFSADTEFPSCDGPPVSWVARSASGPDGCVKNHKSLARENKTGCRRTGNHQVPHAADPTTSDRTDHVPRRCACLTFVRFIHRSLRCNDLGLAAAVTVVKL